MEQMSEQSRRAFLQGWEIYSRAYGPIMEPAFRDDEHARVKLVSALNRMYGKDLNAAISHLEDIRERCCYDADWAAWSFFVGLCFDMAGDTEHMLHCYNACVSYEPAFYLPYMKAAMAEHAAADFGAAAEHYKKALERLSEMAEEPKVNDSIALAYTSLISCLTMMHRYGEAERFLKQSGAGSAVFAAVGAVLYAAMGNRPKAEMQLARLEFQDEEQAAHVRALAEDIFEGRNAHFHPLPVEEEKIKEFWRWFADNENRLSAESIGPQLRAVFPFLERDARLSMAEDGTKQIIFKDSYAMSLQLGYGKLIAACPQVIKEEWCFSITR